MHFVQDFIHVYQAGKPVSPLTYQLKTKLPALKENDAMIVPKSNAKATISSFDIDSAEQRELVNNLAKHVLYGKKLKMHNCHLKNLSNSSPV